MHSFLDYIMGGCQIQFTVSRFYVCSYLGNEVGEWCWVWGMRRQKSLKILGQLCSSLIAKTSYIIRIPVVAQWLTNPGGIHEDVGLIPGLAQ